jgi:flagellar protein FliO/FliZ
MSLPLDVTLDWMVAAASADASALGAPGLPSYGGLLLKTVVALLIVLILAWALLRWGLPRLLPGGRATATGPLRVVARQPLDARHSVVVLESYGRFLLLGVADGSISLLSEIPAEAVARAERSTPAPGRRFADVLRTVLGRPAAPSSPPPEAGTDAARPGPDHQDGG